MVSTEAEMPKKGLNRRNKRRSRAIFVPNRDPFEKTNSPDPVELGFQLRPELADKREQILREARAQWM